MIRFKQHGDFQKTKKYLTGIKRPVKYEVLNRFGRMGVDALMTSTPVDSGETARAWGYEIEEKGDRVSLVFTNSNVNDGVQIAVIIQYGHGTGTGGWVEGRDYINPVIRPLFDQMVEEIWKGVTRS